jgi:predicted transposase YbfD/YdcC
MHHRQEVWAQLAVEKNRERRRLKLFFSLPCCPADVDPSSLLALNRGHWAIENSHHYVRDVRLQEIALASVWGILLKFSLFAAI